MLITIIGGTGFIGRRLAERALADGALLRVVSRSAAHNGAGNKRGNASIEYISGNITDDGTADRATANSWAVVNLAGTTIAASERAFYALHCEAPARVAEAASANGVRRLVHVSAMGVSRMAPALADRSKAEGEIAVMSAFPGANIVRPSLVFGHGDHFFGRFAPLIRRAPIVPLIGGGVTRFEPMHVDDFVDAVARMLASDDTLERAYDLGGPEILSLRELLERLCAALDRKPLLVPIPFALAELLAQATAFLPRAPLTADQVRLLRTDKVHRAGAGRPGDLGVEPRSIASHYAELARSGRRS